MPTESSFTAKTVQQAQKELEEYCKVHTTADCVTFYYQANLFNLKQKSSYCKMATAEPPRGAIWKLLFKGYTMYVKKMINIKIVQFMMRLKLQKIIQ